MEFAHELPSMLDSSVDQNFVRTLLADVGEGILIKQIDLLEAQVTRLSSDLWGRETQIGRLILGIIGVSGLGLAGWVAYLSTLASHAQ
jgi:hypothetical protein